MDRELSYHAFSNSYEDWKDGICIFAHHGFFGLFPDSLHNKIMKLDSKLSHLVELKDDDHSLEETWIQEKKMGTEVLTISDDLRQEIRRLLNVATILKKFSTYPI